PETAMTGRLLRSVVTAGNHRDSVMPSHLSRGKPESASERTPLMTDLTNRITRSGLRARSRSTFPLGRWQVRRSGYGAMQLAGPWADNPPEDWASAISLLRAAITAGVDHIDTAQYYGPDIVNDLIREALYPYPPQLAIVSKVGVF